MIFSEALEVIRINVKILRQRNMDYEISTWSVRTLLKEKVVYIIIMDEPNKKKVSKIQWKTDYHQHIILELEVTKDITRPL